MGKIAQGILGGLSGKGGNVIGGSWKGIDYIRTKLLSAKDRKVWFRLKSTKANLLW